MEKEVRRGLTPLLSQGHDLRWPAYYNKVRGISGDLNLLSNDMGTLTFARASSAWNSYNNTLTASGSPRVRPLVINGITYPTGMYLAEVERTNIITYSEDFGNVLWVKSRSTVTTNTIANPLDGATTADSFIEDTTASNTHQNQWNNFTTVNGEVWFFSIYVKRFSGVGSDRNLRITFPASFGGTAVNAGFNLSNGTISSNTTTYAGIEALANGWFRCWAGHATTVTGATADVNYQLMSGLNNSYTGDGVSGLYVFGAQLEKVVNCFEPSSYIATSGVSATRLADNIELTLNKAFTQVGTAFYKIILPYGTMIDRNTSDIIHGTDIDASGGDIILHRVDSSDNNAITLDSDALSNFTFAHVWDGNAQLHKAYLNGVFISSVATETAFNTLMSEVLKIGNITALTASINGWVGGVWYEQALTDQQILALHNSVSTP